MNRLAYDRAITGRYSDLATAIVIVGNADNTGADGRQEVPHLHMHVMGGPRPWLKG